MPRRPFRLLQEEDRTLAKHLRDRYKKTGPTGEGKAFTGAERKRLHDKRNEIINAVRDLAWFAGEWPEPQLTGILGASNPDMRSLIGHLIGKEESKRSERQYQLARLLAIESLNVLDDKVPGHDGHSAADALTYQEMMEPFRKAKQLIMATVDRGYQIEK
jgi:hypothetical protein